jgi:hypothetical protein
LPRVDLTPLTALLNALEAKHDDAPPSAWVGERYVDSGPLLRLERPGEPLSKAARYGHPSERYAALLSPEGGAAGACPTTAIPVPVLVAAVEGYLQAAYGRNASDGERTEPRFGWSWKDIREFNERVAGPRVTAWLWSEHQLRYQHPLGKEPSEEDA